MKIISTLISLNLTRMDIKMAKTMSANIEISAPDRALSYAKADLARALNYAGMDALKQLGETPVIKPDNSNGQVFTKEFDTTGFITATTYGHLKNLLVPFVQAGDTYNTDNVVLEKVI